MSLLIPMAAFTKSLLSINSKTNINFVNRNSIETKVTIIFLSVNARGGSKKSAASRMVHIAAVIN